MLWLHFTKFLSSGMSKTSYSKDFKEFIIQIYSKMPVDKGLLTSLSCVIQEPKGEILVYLLTISRISACKPILLISVSNN